MPSDSNRVLQLLRAFATSYPVRDESFPSLYAEILADSASNMLVAELGDEVAGYCLAVRLPTLFAGGPIVEIVELMVDPPSRRRGLGKRLVGAQVSWARELGCKEIVVPTRRAREFYERLGFQETATLFKLSGAEFEERGECSDASETSPTC